MNEVDEVLGSLAESALHVEADAVLQFLRKKRGLGADMAAMAATFVVAQLLSCNANSEEDLADGIDRFGLLLKAAAEEFFETREMGGKNEVRNFPIANDPRSRALGRLPSTPCSPTKVSRAR